MIALSCGIKISAVRHLVLPQCMRVADGQTDGQTDGQNYDSQDHPRICSRGKNGGLDQCGAEPFEQQRFSAPGAEGVSLTRQCGVVIVSVASVCVSCRPMSCSRYNF